MLGLCFPVQDASKDKSSTFSMASVTNFTWDGLFIFGPYTPAYEIEKALGFSWPPARKSGIDIPESMSLLVFTHKNKVVQYYEYSRWYGDFSSLSNTDLYYLAKITPNAAVFSAVQKNGLLEVIYIDTAKHDG